MPFSAQTKIELIRILYGDSTQSLMYCCDSPKIYSTYSNSLSPLAIITKAQEPLDMRMWNQLCILFDSLRFELFDIIRHSLETPPPFPQSCLRRLLGFLMENNICLTFAWSSRALCAAGLGHLISCILINGAQYFKRISESGIKKMCRNIFVLQQNLTNITMSREADLDFAR